MAKRRMLSIDFCESDLFFSLSPVTRMLYVHFVLSADDEGFVDKWKSVMRYAKIQNKFYQPLVDVGYVIEIIYRCNNPLYSTKFSGQKVLFSRNHLVYNPVA